MAISATTRLVMENPAVFVRHDNLAAVWNLFFLLDDPPTSSTITNGSNTTTIRETSNDDDDTGGSSVRRRRVGTMLVGTAISGTRLAIFEALKTLAPLYASQHRSLTLQIVSRLLRLPDKSKREIASIESCLEVIFRQVVTITHSDAKYSLYPTFLALLTAHHESYYDCLPWAITCYTQLLKDLNAPKQQQQQPELKENISRTRKPSLDDTHTGQLSSIAAKRSPSLPTPSTLSAATSPVLSVATLSSSTTTAIATSPRHASGVSPTPGTTVPSLAPLNTNNSPIPPLVGGLVTASSPVSMVSPVNGSPLQSPRTLATSSPFVSSSSSVPFTATQQSTLLPSSRLSAAARRRASLGDLRLILPKQLDEFYSSLCNHFRASQPLIRYGAALCLHSIIPVSHTSTFCLFLQRQTICCDIVIPYFGVSKPLIVFKCGRWLF
jgi:hypothetical protein